MVEILILGKRKNFKQAEVDLHEQKLNAIKLINSQIKFLFGNKAITNKKFRSKYKNLLNTFQHSNTCFRQDAILPPYKINYEGGTEKIFLKKENYYFCIIQ